MMLSNINSRSQMCHGYALHVHVHLSLRHRQEVLVKGYTKQLMMQILMQEEVKRLIVHVYIPKVV